MINDSRFYSELNKIFDANPTVDFIRTPRFAPVYNDNSYAAVQWWLGFARQLFGDGFVDRSRETLLRKNEEYAGEDDRYSNFKLAATLAACTAMTALNMFKLKHYVWFENFVKKGCKAPQEQAAEHIGDIFNYTVLGYIYQTFIINHSKEI